MSTKILPLAVLDKCIGSNIWILMKGKVNVLDVRTEVVFWGFKRI